MKCVVAALLMVAIAGNAQKSRELKNLRDYYSCEELAISLTKNKETELAKVSSIFYWITQNIEYRLRSFASRANARKYVEPPDDTFALKPLDERVAENVLRNGVAVCDGFARLFKTLCVYAGIESEVVHGYARTGSGRFTSNHTWNAVKIDGEWKLLDVTWASGFISFNGMEFIRRFDDRYFLSDPRTFAQDHYPEDLKWTLLDETLSMAEFRNSPYKHKSFIKYNITQLNPQRGVIDARIGDTVRIQLFSSDPAKDSSVSPYLLFDTMSCISEKSRLLRPSIISNDIAYSYVVENAAVEWLYLMYNDDLILRYKIRVK